MDFEWQTGHGPADISSPFHQLTQKYGTKREILVPSPPSRKLFVNGHFPGGFESPLKESTTANQTSSFFSATPHQATPFRNPSFASTPSQAPPKTVPFRSDAFTTPRKPFDDIYSEASGAESSPGMAADNEDTPDTKPQQKTKAFSIKPSEKKTLFTRPHLSKSPGEVLRRNKYDINNPHSQRVQKRRRMDRERELVLNSSRRSSFDSSDESRPSSASRPSKATNATVPRLGYFASFTHFLSSHPDLPGIVARWAQTSFNIFLIGLGMWILYCFLAAIQAEVEIERLKAVDALSSEIAKCVADYTANRCARDTRLPALEGPCRAWEDCFSRDPERVGRARVGAGTFMIILNNFFDGASFKTMACLAMVIFAFIAASNMGFTAARQKLHDHPPANYQQPQWGPQPMNPQEWHFPGQLMSPQVGATPRRLAGGMGYGHDDFEGFRAIMPSGTPMKSSRKASRN